MQLLSQKKNRDRTRYFNSTCEKNCKHQLSPEPQDKKQVRWSKLSMAEVMIEET